MNVGKKWTQEEDEELLDSYANNELNLSDIAEIHERTPLGIATRLVRLGAVENIVSVRGYAGRVPYHLKESKNCTKCLTLTEENCELKLQIAEDINYKNKCKELTEYNEYIKLQLDEAMKTISKLTELL